MPAPPRAERRAMWLASYPKSGNTWFRKLWRAFSGRSGAGDLSDGASLSARRVFENVTGLSASDLTWRERHAALAEVWTRAAAGPGEIRPIKAHDAYRSPETGAPVFSAAVSLGAVYLARNPLDVAVSFTFFMVSEGAEPDFDRTIETMNDPARWLGEKGRVSMMPQFVSDWSGHVRSWLDQTDIKVALVRYEDMLADTAGAFSRALTTLGVPGADDGARIAAAVDAARFDRLRAEEDKTGFQEKPEGAERFFREGKAGGWRKHLTGDQARRIVDAHGAMMARLGYDTEI